MNRRKFLSRLGVGIAVAAVAPSVLLAEAPACVVVAAPLTMPILPVEVIGEYCNYANFSSFAIATAIDEQVAYAAEELGHLAGLSMNELYQVAA